MMGREGARGWVGVVLMGTGFWQRTLLGEMYMLGKGNSARERVVHFSEVERVLSEGRRDLGGCEPSTAFIQRFASSPGFESTDV